MGQLVYPLLSIETICSVQGASGKLEQSDLHDSIVFLPQVSMIGKNVKQQKILWRINGDESHGK